MVQKESGDDYIRRIATFIRTHETNLAQGGLARRRRRKPTEQQASASASSLNPLSWFGAAAAPSDASNTTTVTKPATFSSDTHRLFYLLVRLEALGLDVGSLDVRVDNPARPMSYVDVFGGTNDQEKSDVLSLMSFRTSLSGISKLSLGSGGGWWGKPASPPPTVDAELKYIYSSFNVLPALSLTAPGPKANAIEDQAADGEPNALPLDVFRTVEVLEVTDVDPRTILGWDRLSKSLRALTIKKSGLEDITDVFVTAVIEDTARREGKLGIASRRVGSEHVQVPDTVHEEPEHEHDDLATPTVERPNGLGISKADTKLNSLSWAFLKHLSLSDNALTFIPSTPLQYLASLTHLNLSSNLLVSVPPGLSSLYNLTMLDLSDNMIDSVLGIYTQLGQILTLNLSRNRLESLCGLERLLALERVNLTHNLVEESAEVGRLALLPNIAAVSVDGNPLTEYEEGWRVRCFMHFWEEGKMEVLLDGMPAGWAEKRHMASPPPEQMTSTRRASVAGGIGIVPMVSASPPAVPMGSINATRMGMTSPSVKSTTRPLGAGVGENSNTSPGPSEPSSSHASPQLSAVGVKAKKKRPKRIVNLDGGDDDEPISNQRGHRKMFSDGGARQRRTSPSPGGASMRRSPKPKKMGAASPTMSPKAMAMGLPPAPTSPMSPTSQASQKLAASQTPTSQSPATPASSASSPRATRVEGTGDSERDQVSPLGMGTMGRPKPKSRHSRYMTEFAAASSSPPSGLPSAADLVSPPLQSPRTPAVASDASSTTGLPSSSSGSGSGLLPSPGQASTNSNGNWSAQGGKAGSTTLGRASKRRSRVSASVYEPSLSPGIDVSASLASSTSYGAMAGSPYGSSKGGYNNGYFNGGNSNSEAIERDGPETEARRQQRQAEAYRARIEALRSEVGEGWLKVFSQSGLGSPRNGDAGSR